VTHPTTARAIADTPANTPSPMGRTESVLPGTAAAPAGALGDSVEDAVTEDADWVLVCVALVAPSLEVELGADELGGIGIELMTPTPIGMLVVVGVVVADMERVLAVIKAPIDVVDAVIMDVLPPSTGTSVHEVTSTNLDCPFTTVGVRVIVHVRMKTVPLSVTVVVFVNLPRSTNVPPNSFSSLVAHGLAPTGDRINRKAKVYRVKRVKFKAIWRVLGLQDRIEREQHPKGAVVCEGKYVRRTAN